MSAKPFYSPSNPSTKKIQDAYIIALEAHGEQKYGPHQYSKHLEDVIKCLERFGFNSRNAASSSMIEDIICAAWLHDVVEDTEISLARIEEQLGFSVMDIVARVTDENAPTRDERKALTYPKIRGHFGATVVKLADRISNVKASWSDNQYQFQKYCEEHKKFQEAAYAPMLAEPMWAYLQFWINQKFNLKPTPLERAQLFFERRPDVKIDIVALIENGDLRIEDYAIGESIKSHFDGDVDYERVVTVKSGHKDSVLLALLNQRFQGNSAISEIQDWLFENGIPFEIWSG